MSLRRLFDYCSNPYWSWNPEFHASYASSHISRISSRTPRSFPCALTEHLRKRVYKWNDSAHPPLTRCSCFIAYIICFWSAMASSFKDLRYIPSTHTISQARVNNPSAREAETEGSGSSMASLTYEWGSSSVRDNISIVTEEDISDDTDLISKCVLIYTPTHTSPPHIHTHPTDGEGEPVSSSLSCDRGLWWESSVIQPKGLEPFSILPQPPKC